MNPFNLPGPEFLLLYFCFSLVAVIAMVVLRNRAESGGAPKMDLADPYLIAYLRGGENETLRVAVISLVDRGMLAQEGRTIRRAEPLPAVVDPASLDYAILKKFQVPAAAASVFKDRNLTYLLKSYNEKLQLAGLLPNSEIRGARWRRLLITILALGTVGMIKVIKGLSLGKSVSLLIILMLAAMVIASVLSFPRLTARGKATLEDISNLYSGLRTQVASISPGAGSPELAMLAAVFGIAALVATPFGFADDLFPRSRGGLSCGSSWGASCDSSCGSTSFSSDSSCSSSDSGSGGSSDSGSSCGSSSDSGGGGGCGGCGS